MSDREPLRPNAGDQEDGESPSGLVGAAGSGLGIFSGAPQMTEEQLRQRGQTLSEAEQALVTQQSEELAFARIQVAGRCLFCMLCCIVLPLCIAIFAVTIWAAVAVDQDADKECDTPIRAYVWGFIALLCWVSWCQGLFIKCVLGYDPREDGAERPLRVSIYQGVFLLINVAWNIAGLVWVITSETCAETAPALYNSAKVLVFLQLSVYILLAFVMASLMWMIWAVRHGQIQSNAAPDGFVNSLEVIQFDPALFDDDTNPKDCPICYDAFDHEGGDKAIVKTPCNHVYHRQCLGNWLRSQRTCPVCRTDLVQATEPSPAQSAV